MAKNQRERIKMFLNINHLSHNLSNSSSVNKLMSCTQYCVFILENSEHDWREGGGFSVSSLTGRINSNTALGSRYKNQSTWCHLFCPCVCVWPTWGKSNPGHPWHKDSRESNLSIPLPITEKINTQQHKHVLSD